MARERLTYLLIAVFLWVCASRAQNAPSPPPLPASEPSTLGEVFRLTPTGTWEVLDRVKMKTQNVGKAYKEKRLGPELQNYTIYCEGEASSVVFKPGEAQVLAVRLLDPSGRLKHEPPGQVTQMHVQDGRRFLTKLELPLEARKYGNPTPGLDSKNPDRLAWSYQLVPRQTLPPGEYYVLTIVSGKLGTVAPKHFTFGVAGP